MKSGSRQSVSSSTVVFAAFFFVAGLADGQTLSWGVNGAGGSGNWDTTTADWFNGSQNVTWPSGGNAIFGGAAGGTVNSFTFGPVVSSITFNTPGYVIQNGYLQSGTNGLTVTTNVDATIGSNLENSASAGNFLVKNGPAALVLSGGTNFLGAAQVSQGELQLAGSSNLFFSSVTLADAPGVTVTLAQSSSITDMMSLAGGGTSGGIVQPNNQARTVTLDIFRGGNFGGVLQDNGSGILAVDLFGTNSTETLTNVNTYSGSTSVSGNLVLTGNGSAPNSSVSVFPFSSLVLDDTGVVVANRISDSKAVGLNGGSLQLKGNSATPVEEVLGSLTVTGVGNVTVMQPGSAAAELTFAGLQRNGHATLNVVGPGIRFVGLSNGANGIVPVYVTLGNEWATVGGDGRFAPYSAYAGDLNSGSTSDHVKLTSSGTTLLAAPTTRASLNMQNSDATVGQVLDLAGKSLALTSGGLLSSGAGSGDIRNGDLSTTGQELVITANNNLTIESRIVQTSTTSVTKTGPGTLTLTAANTYTGPTAIMQGTVIVSSDANLGLANGVELSGGTLQAAANFSSTKGFTSNSSLIGSVDTAGFNVTFSGLNAGNVNKKGLGTLTLSNPSTGNTSVSAGTLILPNATSGTATVTGGTLQVAGTLSSLTDNGFSTIPVLDIGGPAAAQLTTGTFNGNPIGAMRINFGVGAAASDFWAISSGPVFLPSNSGAFQFEFQNLGGAKTGVDYPLMSFSAAFTPSPNVFAFAPDMAAAGWAGTFKATTTGVSVRFSSVPVPEPFSVGLLWQGSVLALLAYRRFLGKK